MAAVQQMSGGKQWSLLVARAWADEDFKKRLMNDPATVLREHGMEVPDDVELRVVEETDKVHYLTLPASPSGELSDEELVGSASADSYSGFSGYSGRCGCGGSRSCRVCRDCI